MNTFPGTRIVAPLGRLPWYRRVDWRIVIALVLCAAGTAFVIWCAAKAVRP